jgi:hypothetical protein
MARRTHYWNGRWGRLARHDVLLGEDAGIWVVEDRKGGTEGRSRYYEHRDEAAALEQLRILMTGDGWRELAS